MDKELANEIVQLMLKTGAELDGILKSIKEKSDITEFNYYGKSIGNIMGYMLTEVMNPIFKEHPDLKPKELQ